MNSKAIRRNYMTLGKERLYFMDIQVKYFCASEKLL